MATAKPWTPTPSVIVRCHGVAIKRIRRFPVPSAQRVLIEDHQCPKCKTVYFVDISVGTA